MESPSLPHAASSLSHWHRTTRSFPYLHSNSLVPVPASTKYLVIGSGISGALTAWKLIEGGVEAEDVLILEAREAVAGATGRNAGHVRPDAFRGFPDYAAIHGPEQARKIIENEKVVLARVKEFVETNNVACDFRYTNTFDVCLSQESADSQARALLAYKAAGGDVSGVKFCQGQEARARTRVPTAICAYEYPAASNHPGKLTQWILTDVITKGGKFWAHCPATKITKYDSPAETGFRWNVHTPRGVVAAEVVIHCTNAYAAFLLPQLAKVVTPRRGQIHAFVPPASLSGENAMKHTMSLRYGCKSFFSVNSLSDGTIVLGGSGTRSDADRSPAKMAWLLNFDDTQYNEDTAQNAVREFLMLSSSSDDASGLRHGEGLDHVWTGIIGMTPDSAPLVGAIDGLDGQWICAGFNGHGMAKIFTCAPGLAKLVLGKPWSSTGLPECFQFTKERADKLISQWTNGV